MIQLINMQFDFTDRKLPDKAAERRTSHEANDQRYHHSRRDRHAGTYLPFWQWDGTRWMGTLALSVVAWIVLVAMEPEKKNDHFRDLTKMHG